MWGGARTGEDDEMSVSDRTDGHPFDSVRFKHLTIRRRRKSIKSNRGEENDRSTTIN